MPTIGPNGQLLYGPTEVAQDYANLWGANLRNQAAQFELGQARQQPIYNQLMALRDMQNPQQGDILAAIGAGTRLGGDPNGVIASMVDEARQGNPNWGGFVRRMSLMGVPPGQQMEAAYERGGLSPTALWTMQPVWNPQKQTYEAMPVWKRLGFAAPGQFGQGGAGAQAQGAPDSVGTAGAPDIEGAIGQASQDTGIPQPVLHAMFTQESSLGRTSRNIGQITEGTARNPGFNMPALTPDQVNDPATNIAWSARYLKARGEAAGVTDWNDPGQVATALREYNGGGDPNYVQHVFGHMAFQPYRVASTGAVAPPGAGAAVTPAAAAAAPGYTGGTPYYGDLPPPGFPEQLKPIITRGNELIDQAKNAPQQRILLQQMEADLEKYTTGSGSVGASAWRQLLLGMHLEQRDAGSVAEIQAAGEQFNKGSAMLGGTQLGAMGGPSDQRQELAREMNPGSSLSKLGNQGIIRMLLGNNDAMKVMADEWQTALNAGAPPGSYDRWRQQFYDRADNGGRFDPRVFWMANMPPDQAQKFIDMQNGVVQAQLKADIDLAEQRGWIRPKQGGGWEAR